MQNITTQIIQSGYTLGDTLRTISDYMAYGRLSKEERGELAELGVFYILLALQQQYPNIKIYHSILLRTNPNNDWTTEVDFVLVTPYKIFVIETKSYYGITTVKDTLLKVQVKNTSYEHEVFKQNQGHCKAIYKYIYPYITSSGVIQPVITMFCNGTIRDTRNKKLQTQFPVLVIGELFDYLSTTLFKYYQSSANYLVSYDAVNSILTANNLQSEDAMLAHINRIKSLRR